jgi:radical SAM-linked protein
LRVASIFPFRVRFTKLGRLRFLSHHDLQRLFERALRRTELPLRFSEGFNPHPLIAFPTALGLGIESDDEIVEFELSTWVPPKAIQERLAAQMPEGCTITAVEIFLRKDRSFIDFVEYSALCPGQTEGLEARIAEFFAKKEVIVERKSDKAARDIEVRQYAMAVTVEGDRVLMRLKVTDAGTAKADEILRALGLEIRPDVRIKKTYTEVGVR